MPPSVGLCTMQLAMRCQHRSSPKTNMLTMLPWIDRRARSWSGHHKLLHGFNLYFFVFFIFFNSFILASASISPRGDFLFNPFLLLPHPSSGEVYSGLHRRTSLS